jgi:threonylcarbamoyladenosine tRNA methylthiotransferase MtaB
MRIHLQTLGCRLNEAELETWSRDFRARGHQITANIDEADVLVINTCAVTQEAVRKSRKLLRRAQRANPLAKLVVSGCYASLEAHDAATTPGIDLLVANHDKDQLVEIASEQLAFDAMPLSATEPGENSLLAHGRQRAFIKVQDGCRYRCTFCIVTEARGAERSRPLNEVIEQINLLHSEGIREVVLTGVHIGGYGSDNGSNLSQLIDSVLRHTDMPRVRIGSVEPWDLPEEFWGLFDNRRFLPHLHLPLQSGSDRVLRRMARRCKTAEYRHLLEQARAQVADINVTTDIIVGFPGETDEEWRETLDYVADIGFGHVHIFPFSPRAGTKAASLPGAIAAEIKKQRVQQLHELTRRMKQQTLQRFVGRRFPVLMENRSRDTAGEHSGWNGYTPNFLPVLTASTEQNLENRIIEVVLERLNHDGDTLLARQP